MVRGMDLDLAQVRAFVLAAEESHFGRAAAALSISQQALSKRIARLESGLSTVLLSAMSVNRNESVASMMAPANARPNERPKLPAAEFTPAASLTRSSSTGARV